MGLVGLSYASGPSPYRVMVSLYLGFAADVFIPVVDRAVVLLLS